MPKGAKAMTGWTPEEIEQAKLLLPFLEAGRRGLLSSQWRPGAPVEDLLAPIVLHVLAEAGRRLRIGELLAEVPRG